MTHRFLPKTVREYLWRNYGTRCPGGCNRKFKTFGAMVTHAKYACPETLEEIASRVCVNAGRALYGKLRGRGTSA